MTGTQIHAVKGLAAKLTNDEITPPRAAQDTFNPRLYHRGIVDLQEYILTLNNNPHTQLPDSKTTYTHEYNDTDNTLTVTKNTPLSSVVNAIPRGWDATVVIDSNDSYTGHYVVSTVLHCGGGTRIQTKLNIREHCIEQLAIEITNPADNPPETHTVDNITFPHPPGDTARLIRRLTKLITAAYTTSISTAARAFDYAMTEPTPSNNRPQPSKTPFKFNQNQWGNIRGTSRQTITNNLSKARDELGQNGVDDLHGDPLRFTSTTQHPALKPTDDKENAYVVLV